MQVCEEYLSRRSVGRLILKGFILSDWSQRLKDAYAKRASLDAGPDDVTGSDVNPLPSTSEEPDIEVVEEVDDIGSIVHPDDVSWIEVSSITPGCNIVSLPVSP